MEKKSVQLNISGDVEENIRCSLCHESFQKPLLASNSSNGLTLVYYACPRCLSKVGDVKQTGDIEGEKESLIVSGKCKEVEDSVKADCRHFLGYLRKRPKDSPFPDECLVCERMIECLSC